jgi:AraC-like DNA-binding protein
LWLPNIHYTAVAIIFSDSWLNKMNSFFPFSKEIKTFIDKAKSIYFNSDISPNLRLALKQILDFRTSAKKSSSLIQLKSLEMIFYFFDNVFAHISTSKKNLSIHPHDLRKMNNYIDTLNYRIDRLPTLEEAAETTGMSKSKFQRLFKKIFRRTFYSYILELRMNYALELLMSKKSVSVVALETGYSSLSNFTIAFKRYFNYLPSEL